MDKKGFSAMTTPNTWRPDGASDHEGWKVIAPLILAVGRRVAQFSNTPDEREAVRAVNEWLEQLGLNRNVATIPGVMEGDGSSDKPFKFKVPSSDAAEGAGDIARCIETIDNSYAFKVDGGIALQNCGEWIYLKKLLLNVPPKPALDAMQILIKRFPEINPGNYNDYDVEALNNWGIEVIAALSAPVPSPDGAGENQTDRQPSTAMTNAQLAMALRNNLSLVGSREKLRELMAAAAARLVANPEQSELIRRCAKIAEPWPGFWLDENSSDADRAIVAVRTEIAKAILALSPSPTGAAGIPDGFCSPGGKESCLHLQERERCSDCPVNEEVGNAKRDRFEAEQHIARFLARLVYDRGIAYGAYLESEDAWVDANWRFFLGDARRPGGVAVGVTGEAIARAIFKNRQHLSDEDVNRWFKIYADQPEGTDHFRMAIWRAYSDAEAILALSPVPDATVSEEPATVEPTQAQVRSACLSFRHDFGLMTIAEAAILKSQARDWLQAWQKEGFAFPANGGGRG